MYRFHAKIGQRQLVAARQRGKDRRVEVTGRVERHPPWTDDMAGMHDRGGKAVYARSFVQIALNRRFLGAIGAERAARLLLGHWRHGGGTVYPDRAAVQ